jgi:hypothetical protein
MERDTRLADALVCDDLIRTSPSQNPFQIVSVRVEMSALELAGLKGSMV